MPIDREISLCSQTQWTPTIWSLRSDEFPRDAGTGGTVLSASNSTALDLSVVKKIRTNHDY